MPRVVFTENIQRHCPPSEVAGDTVREVLEAVFAANERARGYVLDEQGAVRKHIIVLVDDQMIRGRETLSDPVPSDGEVYVMQAFSGVVLKFSLARRPSQSHSPAGDKTKTGVEPWTPDSTSTSPSQLKRRCSKPS